MAKPAASVRGKATAVLGPAPDPVQAPGRDYLALTDIDASAVRTRELREAHVAALAESIAALGLIHPPAVDRRNRLLAGAHRMAALRWLERHQPQRFAELFPRGVPIWRMDLNAESDVDLALAVEISENEQRRDYSHAEIQRLADRLRAAGFHYTSEGGRPRSDARPLMPALEIIVGKSVRQLRRILNPPAPKPAEKPKTGTRDLVSDLETLADHSRLVSQRLGQSLDVPELFTLKAQLDRVHRLTLTALAALAK